jgi:microcompartment protein CcmK/EutM
MSTHVLERSVARALTVALLAAAALHVAGAVVAGVVGIIGDDTSFPSGRARAGQVLTAFGQAGGAEDVLLVIVAVALLAWRWRETVGSTRALLTSRWLFVAIALLVTARCVGTVLIATIFSSVGAAENISATLGAGLGDLVLCTGGFLVARNVSAAESELADEAILFAVDRVDGEVFAFYSWGEAERTLNVYSIEDDEFAFYDEGGRVVDAAVDRERVRFSVTCGSSSRRMACTSPPMSPTIRRRTSSR